MTAADSGAPRIDTARLRDIADLDSRAGGPVGNALREAADEIDRLRARLANVEAERDAQDAAASYWYGKWVAAAAGAWCGLGPAERCVNCGKTLTEHVRPRGVSCYEREEDNRGE